MFRRSANPTLTRVLADALLAALSARPAAALLDVPTVHLCTNIPSITPVSVVGDFVEATFTGYLEQALPALTGPLILETDTQGVFGQVTFVTGTPMVITETVTGYYVTNTAGTILYQAELFDNPVPIANYGDFLSLDCVIPVREVIEVP